MSRLKPLFVNGWLAGAALGFSLTAHAFDIAWNGFGSAYYSQALSQDFLPSGFTSTHVNFTSLSLMGLNVSARIDENLNFAAQLVALGNAVGTSDSFGTIAQWAYVSYTPTEQVTFKAGRQLYPVYLASEYARVGYLLPYRQIPATIFAIAPFTRFDGAAAYYKANLGFGWLTGGIFGGTPIVDGNTTTLAELHETLQVADLLGGQLTLDGDGWRVRAMASRIFTGATSTAGAFTALGGHEQTYSGGYRFDRYGFVSWGEYIFTRTPDGSYSAGGRLGGDGHGYYLLEGYRIGKFLPRYMFSQASANFNFPSGPVIAGNGEVTAHTFGVNYQTSPQSVVKVQYEHSLAPSAPGASGYFATQPATSTATSGDAFFAGIDFIF